ncbi:hypothetical protein Tco_1338599 [Tanacetum coccineum]
MIEGHQVQRIHVNGESSSEIMYEHYFRNFNADIRSRIRKCKAPLVSFSGETYHPLGIIDLWVTMGAAGNNKTVPMEFAIVKCRSPYNVIIRRTIMRSLGAVGTTIHSMIKFLTTQGIEEQMSRIREHARTQTKNSFGSRPTLPEEESNNKETMIINPEHPEQFITVGVTLPANCKRRLRDVLQENIDVFARSGSKGTAAP